MNTRLHRFPSVATLALAAAVALGLSVPCAQAAAASGADAPGEQTAAQASGTPYLNGGIGDTSQKKMQREARDWPLRMTFSAHANDEYVADVKLHVQDANGNELLMLNGAGPLTYVRLKPGTYRISASHDGVTQVRTVHVGTGTEINFHWKD